MRGESIHGSSMEVHCSLFHKQEHTPDNVATLILTNYRLRVVWKNTALTAIEPMDLPLLAIEALEVTKEAADAKGLKLRCKDVRVVYVVFLKRDTFYDMLRIKLESLLRNLTMEHIFAFARGRDAAATAAASAAIEDGWRVYDAEAELRRLGVRNDGVGGWTIDTQINADYQLSPTYPYLYLFSYFRFFF